MRPWPLEVELLGIPTGLLPPIFLSVLLGAVVGLERELSGHPAGLRTHILVALGATLVTLVSVWLPILSGTGDPGRIAAQVVAGIGFLGAGAILREGAGVRGLTTAASIWTTAMIGVAVGVSPRTALLAVVATILAVAVLSGLHQAEEWMHRRGLRAKSLEIHVTAEREAVPQVVHLLSEQSVAVERILIEPVRGADASRVTIRSRLAAGHGPAQLSGALSGLAGVRHVRFED